MKRRTFLLSAALGTAPLNVHAENPPPILERYIEMLNTRNWSLITEIVSPDYAPAYPDDELAQNRAELQQYLANDWVFGGGLWGPPLVDLVAYAGQDGYVFFLANLTVKRTSGESAVLPYFGYLVVRDDMIVTLENSLDRQVRSSIFGLFS